jgi:hypothetical protein
LDRRPSAVRPRSARPTLEGLEARSLLSTVHHAIHAEAVHARSTVAQLATSPSTSVSTVPANGDVNPYGVAYVPGGFARGETLKPGDVLVSSFNSSANLQGTGTTIVRVAAGSQQSSVFYQGPPGVGLSTALGVLKRGYVVVGALPSTDGTSATAGEGSLLVLDGNGKLVATFASSLLLNGPWDLTINDQGNKAQIFVANVETGTVARFGVAFTANNQLKLLQTTQVAAGYTHRGDPTAFEVGPTGLAFDAKSGTLYVASTADNAVFSVKNAGKIQNGQAPGQVIYRDSVHLHGPLGLAFTPDGNLIASQGDVINSDPNQPSELVEFTRKGKFVGQFSLSTTQGGAFGVATSPDGRSFAAVNDVTNTVTIFPIQPK